MQVRTDRKVSVMIARTLVGIQTMCYEHEASMPTTTLCSVSFLSEPMRISNMERKNYLLMTRSEVIFRRTLEYTVSWAFPLPSITQEQLSRRWPLYGHVSGETNLLHNIYGTLETINFGLRDRILYIWSVHWMINCDALIFIKESCYDKRE